MIGGPAVIPGQALPRPSGANIKPRPQLAFLAHGEHPCGSGGSSCGLQRQQHQQQLQQDCHMSCTRHAGDATALVCKAMRSEVGLVTSSPQGERRRPPCKPQTTGGQDCPGCDYVTESSSWCIEALGAAGAVPTCGA